MKNKKIIIMMSALIVTAVIFAYKFYAVNSRYEKVKIIEYDPLYTFECNDLSYTVTGTELEEDPEHKDAKIMYVKLVVKNKSKEEVKCSFTDIVMDINNNSKCISSIYFYEKNGVNVSLEMNIAPNKVYSVNLPYRIFEDNLPAKKWSNISNADCELVFKLYPEKISVNLKPETN